MRKTACLLLLLLGACATQEPAPSALPTADAAPPSQPRRAVPPVTSTNIDAYKREVAQRIVSASEHVYDGPIQPMLKSIVVLEITIDRAGNPIDISVYRSNGYKHLEASALESVVRAAPFPAPEEGVLDGPGSFTFLETFLFRADDRFQLRSLVAPGALAAARR